MNIIKFKDFIVENNQPVNNKEHDDILIIVDVQANFGKFIPSGLTEKIHNYAEDFKDVYQIWDSNNGVEAPTYDFPNEKAKIEKKFGKNFFNDRLKKFIKEHDSETEGSIFKIKNKNEYLVRVKNNHGWFYINEKLVELFKKLKGKKVVMIGGADQECISDLYVAAKALGVIPIYNHELMYSAETSNKQTVHDVENNQE